MSLTTEIEIEDTEARAYVEDTNSVGHGVFEALVSHSSGDGQQRVGYESRKKETGRFQINSGQLLT